MNTVCLSIDLGLLCFLSAMFYCFHHKDLEHVLLNVHLSFYESVSIARGEENGWMGKMVKGGRRGWSWKREAGLRSLK